MSGQHFHRVSFQLYFPSFYSQQEQRNISSNYKHRSPLSPKTISPFLPTQWLNNFQNYHSIYTTFRTETITPRNISFPNGLPTMRALRYIKHAAFRAAAEPRYMCLCWLKGRSRIKRGERLPRGRRAGRAAKKRCWRRRGSCNNRKVSCSGRRQASEHHLATALTYVTGSHNNFTQLTRDPRQDVERKFPGSLWLSASCGKKEATRGFISRPGGVRGLEKVNVERDAC